MEHELGVVSCKPVAMPQVVLGATNKNMLLLLYQTIIVVATGEVTIPNRQLKIKNNSSNNS
jgi:hypothetical protein